MLSLTNVQILRYSNFGLTNGILLDLFLLIINWANWTHTWGPREGTWLYFWQVKIPNLCIASMIAVIWRAHHWYISLIDLELFIAVEVILNNLRLLDYDVIDFIWCVQISLISPLKSFCKVHCRSVWSEWSKRNFIKRVAHSLGTLFNNYIPLCVWRKICLELSTRPL